MSVDFKFVQVGQLFPFRNTTATQLTNYLIQSNILLKRRMIVQIDESMVDERTREVPNSGGAQSELLIFGSISAYGQQYQ